jgi:hypothetical protein
VANVMVAASVPRLLKVTSLVRTILRHDQVGACTLHAHRCNSVNTAVMWRRGTQCEDSTKFNMPP